MDILKEIMMESIEKKILEFKTEKEIYEYNEYQLQLVLDDLNYVPFIPNLNESVFFDLSVFQTKDARAKNTIVIPLENISKINKSVRNNLGS
jgi:hypothetical protein